MNKNRSIFLILFVFSCLSIFGMSDNRRLYPDIYGSDAEDPEIRAAIQLSLDEQREKDEQEQDDSFKGATVPQQEEDDHFKDAKAPARQELDEDAMEEGKRQSLEQQALERALENSKKENHKQNDYLIIVFLKWLLSLITK